MGQELEAVAAVADHMGDESMAGDVAAAAVVIVVVVVPSLLLMLAKEFVNKSGLSRFCVLSSKSRNVVVAEAHLLFELLFELGVSPSPSPLVDFSRCLLLCLMTSA